MRFIPFHLLVLSLLYLPRLVVMVKQHDFKLCDQSSFCVRQRAYAEYTDYAKDFKSPYSAVKESLIVHENLGTIALDIKNIKENVLLTLNVDFLKVGSIRVRINEKHPLKPRYSGAADLSLSPSALEHVTFKIHHDEDGLKNKDTGKNENEKQFEFMGYTFTVVYEPFRVEVSKDNDPVFLFNHRGYFHFEHLRKKSEVDNSDIDQQNSSSGSGDATQNDVPPSEEDQKKTELLAKMKKDMWEESFNSKEDSKPNGPSSMGIDFTFPGFQHVYGLAEHGSNFSLKTTRGENAYYSEPYRLYNLDVFEYILDSPMALYGSIPYLTTHRKGQTVGLMWLNSAEMWVDFSKSKDDKLNFHWSAESGIVDLFILLGTNPHSVQTQLKSLFGAPAMPQLFATAYHQCRWNYNDEKDVQEVDDGFDQNKIPYDVLWLDIEHTNGKRYFTWDSSKFPTPESMQKQLSAKGRKMVTIIDPHIKTDSDYHVYKEAKAAGLFVKDKNQNDFSGWCWPGDSSWIDYTSEAARKFWSSLFSFDKYTGSTPSLYTWNDMNEPSVFTGPEITMPKDNLHFGGWEHRDVHNIYGMLQQRATFEGHLLRNNNKDRPFVLSRAFFIGTQRYGPIWTGDNFALWDHLAASVPMLLTCGVSGMPFIGADVGGFFGNPEPELLVRWYQVGVFQPFFRAHAHIDTKRREPWLFGEENTALIREAVFQRYKNLPYIYTLNFLANQTGAPINRPMYYEFPEEEKIFGMDDQFMLGSSILVKPVVEPGCKFVDVYLPPSSLWYNYYTQSIVEMGGKSITRFKTPMDKIAVFYRGGTIVSRRERIRRSSSLMMQDPFTLVIALDADGKASGALYVDDGKSYDHEQGKYLLTEFEYEKNTLYGTPKLVEEWKGSLSAEAKKLSSRIERLIILGAKTAYSKANVKDKDGKVVKITGIQGEAGNGGTFKLVVKDPAVMVGESWTVVLE